ncbi:MAG: hypothetical protein SGPRY_001224 [Prymnesium sp.]
MRNCVFSAQSVLLASETTTALREKLNNSNLRNRTMSDATHIVRDGELTSALERAAEAEWVSEQPRKELQQEKDARRQLEQRVNAMQKQVVTLSSSASEAEQMREEVKALRSLLSAQQAQATADTAALDAQLQANAKLRADLARMQGQLKSSELQANHSIRKSPATFPASPRLSQRQQGSSISREASRGSSSSQVWSGSSPISRYPAAVAEAQDIAAQPKTPLTTTSPDKCAVHVSGSQKEASRDGPNPFLMEATDWGSSAVSGDVTNVPSQIDEGIDVRMMDGGFVDAPKEFALPPSQKENSHVQALRRAATEAVFGHAQGVRSKPILAFAEVNAPKAGARCLL